jgi:hypothetical protein
MFPLFGIIHMLFLLLKNGLCMWISAYPLVENNFFLNVPLLLWIWDFVHMYLTQLGIRMWSPASHIYVQKKVYLAPETLLSLLGTVEKNFFFDFEPYDLANGKEWVSKIWWACRHTISYKILWLEVLKNFPFLLTSPCFQ